MDAARRSARKVRWDCFKGVMSRNSVALLKARNGLIIAYRGMADHMSCTPAPTEDS